MMGDRDKGLMRRSNQAEVDAFVRKVATTPRSNTTGAGGHLLFAMDATASREPTWDHACQIQAEMFRETATLGGLEVQLVYYRGFREFYKTKWVKSTEELLRPMARVRCLGGHTQILRVLEHCLTETKTKRVNALVFVGDCMEEDPDRLCHVAGQLGLLGVPAFMFHEGFDPVAAKVFQQIAALTQGAYCRFDSGSADQLRQLLSAVAVYAAGGRMALENFEKRQGNKFLRLTHQLRSR